MFLKYDKGNGIAIFKKDEYISKMLELLNDKKVYKELKKDPTNSILRATDNLLKRWVDKGIIDKNKKWQLQQTSNQLPYMRGGPKVHKENCPFRPIVNFRPSPTYKLAKYIANMLKPLIGNNEYIIKNSKTMADILNVTMISEDETMISLDVESLFTSIPTDMACKIVENMVIDQGLDWDIKEILNAIRICLNATQFKFNGIIYQQIQGTAMGSPLSAIIAEIVMTKLEMNVINDLNEHVKLYKRYVDDSFLIIKKGSEGIVLETFNKFHKNLKFTIEKESQNGIHFLDLGITRGEEGKLKIDIYKKPTDTGYFWSFNSQHTRGQKKALVRSLLTRAMTLPNYSLGKVLAIQDVYKTLTSNGFPKTFIDEVKGDIVSKMLMGGQERNWIGNAKFVVAKYAGKESNHLRNILDRYNIKTIFRPQNTIGTIISNKLDYCKIDRGVIYKINCLDCNSAYIGQTDQHIRKRFDQHRNALRRGDIKNSALTQHFISTKHSRFDFNNHNILDHEPHYRRRLFKESVYIKKCPLKFNRHWEMNSLPEVYNSILDKI